MSEEEEENNKNKEQNNNEEEIEIKDTKEIDLMQKMKEIEQAIIFSWQRDTDRVKEIIECHEFLTQLINNNYTVNDIESKFFNNNEEYFTYFIRNFSLNTSKYLLYQNHVYGENGEEKAFEVLLDYCKFFLKFMLNNSDNDKFKLSNFLETIKLIFNNSNNFYGNNNYYNNNYYNNNIDYNKYNEEYLPKKNQLSISELKEGDEIDVLIQNHDYYNNNQIWVRGKIHSIQERIFYVNVLNNDQPIKLNFSSFDYAKKGLYTKDWEWRLNLKKGDIIDCYKHNRFLPATIIERINDDNKLEYKVSFRIYVKSVENINSYKKFYPDKDIEIDEEKKEEYIGESNFYDEVISMSSKRLKNPKIRLEDVFSFNDDFCIDDLIADVNDKGKKTITIGKSENFSYHFNCLLNEFGNLNGFDIMLNYIQNQKNENNNNKNNSNNELEKQNYNNDILVLIIYIIKTAMPYLYKPLLLNYSKKLSEIILKYFDDITQNELRNLKKETIDLMSDILGECSEILLKYKKIDNSNLLETFNLKLAIKMLKTSILDKRTNAIKKIGEIISNLRRMNDNNFENQLLESIKTNKVIYEIFGPNNHIQLISKSKEIIEFLLLHNELSEDDLNIIWNATKSGNLDEKKIIIKIFNDILMFNYSISDDILLKLFNSTINTNSIGNDISDEEIDFIFTLLNKLNDENIIENCLFFFIDYIKDIQNYNNLKNIINKIYEITRKYPQFKKKIIEKALVFIQNVSSLNIGYKLLILYIKNSSYYIENEIDNLFKGDKSIINLYKKSFKNYYENKDKINKNEHEQNLESMIEFLNILLEKDIWKPKEDSPIDFLYQFLILNKYNESDEKLFYNSVVNYINSHYETLDKVFKSFLNNINLYPNILSPDGFTLFLKMFLKKNNINEKKKNIEYGIYLENIDKSPNELIGFSELKKLIFENTNNEIVDQGIDIIKQLYNNDINKLLDFYLEQINNSKNNIKIILKCISILTEIIYLNEKNGTADVNSHLSLLKGEIIKIKLKSIDFEKDFEKDFEINNNETVYEMKKKITKLLNYHTDFIRLIMKKKENNNSISEIEIKRIDNGKTLKEMGFISNKEIYEINCSKNNLNSKIERKDILDENGNVIEEVKEIFNEWFNKYSENNKMDISHLKLFIKDVTGSKEEISETDLRIKQLMSHQNEEGYIERNVFVNFYINSSRGKKDVVKKNIYTMGYRYNLKKMNQCYYEENTNKENMFRYALGNNTEFVMNLFDLMNLENGGLEIFNFLLKLKTNNDIFNEIINIKNCHDDNINWENILFKKKNFFYLCYVCYIILYFIEHYDENTDFKNWIYIFIIKNGYRYLIDIFIQLLKSITEIKENIDILCFSILLRIITQIYSLINKKDNYIGNQDTNNNDVTYSLSDNLIKENINKINENFINKEIFSLLMNIFELYMKKKNEISVTFSILNLIIYLFSNLDDQQINDKLINLFISGLNSDNEQIGFICCKSIINMCNNFTSKKIVIIKKLFETIANIFNNNENKNPKKYLINCFQYLIKLNFKETELNQNSNFDIISYAKKLINEVNDELTINLNTPKITENKLINDILILTTLSENSEIKNEINNNTQLFENILKNIIFNSSEKKNDEDIIMSDVNNNEEEKMEFINIDNINNSQNTNIFNKTHLQNISYNLILILLKNNITNFQKFFTIEQLNKNNKQNNNNNEIDTRTYNINYNKKKFDHVGLKNLGCICYMNSTMQQLFMIPTLRYSILRFSDNKKKNIINNNEISYINNEGVDDNMFHQCQKLFSYLLLSQKYDYNPFGFTYAFKDIDGNPTKLYEQKDAQEFLAIFLDRLEQASKKSKYKNLVNNVFGIKNCSLITCLSCGKVSYTFDPSVFLSLEVKNMKTLNDSLDKYINEEYIDGYNCEGCKKNCRISKRNILTSLPNVMIIHLQRIFYNWEIEHNEKINSRLEFPKEINMKNYTIEHILNNNENKDENIYFRCDEYYNYYLVGVIIHIGSADSGHYYSYINNIREGEGNINYFNPKDENCLNSWLEFNDSTISQFDIQNLENEAFGGSYDDDNNYSNYRGWIREKSNNAYLLVYERLVKNPYIVYIQKPISDNNSNIIEFNESEEKKIFKDYDMMRFYDKNNLNEYFNKCNELYMKIFHNLKTDEYFKFKPFYFYKNNRKVPKIYYDEIMNDNSQFVEKNKDISEYSNFYNKVISYFGEEISNNSNYVTNENVKEISKRFIKYIINNISNKKQIEFLKNGCSSLIKIIKRNSEIFKDTILKYLKEKKYQIYNSIRYENEIKEQINNLYKEIYSIYNIDSD